MDNGLGALVNLSVDARQARNGLGKADSGAEHSSSEQRDVKDKNMGRNRRSTNHARLGVFRGRTALAIMTVAAFLCRVGEASSACPRQTVVHRPPLTAEWVEMKVPSAVSYPPPHRDGVRDISSPGFQDGERSRAAGEEEDFALIAEMVNTTG